MPIQLDDFTGYKFLSAVAYNPSGTKGAYVLAGANMEKNGYDSDLYLFDPATGQHSALTTCHKVRSFVWYGEHKLVYARTREGEKGSPETWTDFVLVNACGMEKVLFSLPMVAELAGKLSGDRFVLTSVVNLRYEEALKGKSGEERLETLKKLQEEDENIVIFEEYPFWFNARGVISKTRKSVFVYDLESGNCKQITRPLFRTEHLAVDEASGLIAYDGQLLEKVETYRTGIYVYDTAKDEEKQVLPEELYHIEYVNFLQGKVLFGGTDMKEYGVSQCLDLFTVDIDSCQVELLCSRELSIGNPVGSDCRLGGGKVLQVWEDKVYFVFGIEDASHLYSCDSAGNLQAVLEQDGSIDCFAVHGDNVLFVAMYDMRLQELYQGSVSKREFARVSSWNDSFFQEKPPTLPERLWFANADGVEIHGFVLKPANYDPNKQYPAILDIHGGPHLAYGEVFYHEMQYWAQKGYFVLYSNPRGGDGRGNEFGYLSGKFGTIDYDDLMEFCDKALEAYPAIDKDRMGVTGGSYGGFMTNWIIGHTSRFAAAASQRSISNFVSMEGTSDIGTLFAQGQVLATTHTDVEKMWKHSPLQYADRCTTPTLFIHAEEDYRCWMVEALQMYTALINNGVETKLCLFKKENHELSRSGKPKNRIRRLEEITAWMDRYLKP